MVKKCLSILLALSMISIVPVNAENLEIDECFDEYATYELPEEYGYKTQNYIYVCDLEGNKALKMVLLDSSNSVEFTKGVLDKINTFSVKLSTDSAIDGSISAVSSTGSKVEILKVEKGVIKTLDGKTVSNVAAGNKFTKIALVAKTETKRLSIYINNRLALTDWYISSMPEKISGYDLAFSETEEKKQSIFFDDVVLGNGEIPTKEATKKPLNNEVYDVIIEPVEQEIVIGEEIIINSDFNGQAGVAGWTFNEEGTRYERVDDEKTGNGYLNYTGSEDASGTSSVDYAISSDMRNKWFVVCEADIKMEKPGFSGQLFVNRISSTSITYLLKYTKQGEVKTYSGDKTVCTLKKKDWTRISCICDFKKMVFDVYVDGEKKLTNIPMNYVDKKPFYRVRMTMAKGDGTMQFDNVKLYEGTAIRDLSGVKAEKEEKSIMPDGSEAKEILQDSVAISTKNGSIYYNGEKHILETPCHVTNDRTMVPVRVISEAFGEEVDWNEMSKEITIGNKAKMTVGSNNITIGDGVITMDTAPEIVNDTCFLPIRFLAENILGKSVFWDDKGYALIREASTKLSEAAQWKIHDYITYDRPEVEEILADFETHGKDVHPRIVINQDDIDRIKRQYEAGTIAKEWTDKCIEEANKILGYKTVPYDTQGDATPGSMLANVQTILERIEYLGIAYFMTGDMKYPQRAWKELENAGNYPDWNGKFHYLDTAEMMAAFAIGYDWFYDCWSEKQKDFLAQKTREFGMEESRQCYYGVYSGSSGHWPRTTINWNSICNGGTIMAAMAFMEKWPEYCADLVSKGVRGIEMLNRGFYPSGSWTEGITYWGYLTQYQMMSWDSLKHCFGTDYGLSLAPALDISADFVEGMDGPQGSNNFSDSSSSHKIGTFFLWHAKQYNKPMLVTERIRAMEDYGAKMTLYDVLLYDESLINGSKVSYPKDLYFKGVESVGMRSNYNDSEAAWVSYHAGKVDESHGHIDVGSFVMDMSGVRWAMDLGTDSYNLPGYFSELRYTYYRLRGEGHNIMIFDPSSDAGQNKRAETTVESIQSGESNAFSTVDLTEIYKGQVKNYRRGYLLAESRRTITIRDEFEMESGSHEAYWFMHTKAEISIVDDNTALLTRNGKTLKAQLVTNIPDAKFSVMDARPLPTSPNPSGQATNDGTYKLTVHAENVRGKCHIQVRFSDAGDYLSELKPEDVPISDWTVDNSPMQTLPYANALYADGDAIEGFKSTKSAYTVTVSLSRKAMPKITADCDDEFSAEVVDAETVDGVAVVKVSRKANPKEYRIYRVSFKEGLTKNDKIFKPVKITANCEPQEENPAVNACDGNLETQWAADTEGATLTLEYAEPIPIELIAVALYKGSTRKTMFDLQISDDGENWQTFVNYTSSGKTADYEFIRTNAKAKYLRLVGHGNSDGKWTTIIELDVIDKSNW